MQILSTGASRIPVSGFRHPAADEAPRRTREKTSAEGCRSVLPKSSCFDSCFHHNPMRAGRQMRKKCGFSEVGVLPFASYVFPHG